MIAYQMGERTYHIYNIYMIWRYMGEERQHVPPCHIYNMGEEGGVWEGGRLGRRLILGGEGSITDA